MEHSNFEAYSESLILTSSFSSFLQNAFLSKDEF
jgi:hypothetical protein